MGDTTEHVDFFISYTHHDQGWAEWIAWQLEDARYKTVLQAWDFQAGSNFVLAMDDVIRKATRTIAVLSPDYFDSQFAPSEWAAAFRRDPKGEQGLLIPVRVRPCDVKGLLEQIVYIDLAGLDEAAAKVSLLTEVTQQRRKPLAAPLFPSNPPTLASSHPPHPFPVLFQPHLEHPVSTESLFYWSRGSPQTPRRCLSYQANRWRFSATSRQRPGRGGQDADCA